VTVVSRHNAVLPLVLRYLLKVRAERREMHAATVKYDVGLAIAVR
jgi:hypothetical protein